MTHPDTLTIPRAVVEQVVSELIAGTGSIDHINNLLTELTDALQAQPTPPAPFTACTCFDDTAKRYCVKRGKCSVISAYSGIACTGDTDPHNQPTPPVGQREAFEQWAIDYALYAEPLTRDSVREDCYAAWQAAQPQAAAEPVATYADKLHRAMRWYDSGAEDRNEFARLITDLLEHTTPQTTPDCRTCQHLSNVWGVCESRPKCVGGDQYVYFAEKQLWDTTPRNDGQAAHQEMREALYAEFNSAGVPKEYAWECNECGAQEYSMSVSEHNVHELGCGKCGSSEWHKAEVRK